MMMIGVSKWWYNKVSIFFLVVKIKLHTHCGKRFHVSHTIHHICTANEKMSGGVRKRERILRYFDELIDLRERVEMLRKEKMRVLRDGRGGEEEEEREEVEKEAETENAEISRMIREDQESRYVHERRSLEELEHMSAMRKKKDESVFLPLNASLRQLVEEKTSKLRTLKRKRVSELFELYPITKVREKYYIRGKSFSSQNYPDVDGVIVELKRIEGAAALGHCAKLMITLATYMNLSLFHEIRFFGSESCIFDKEDTKHILSPSSSISFSKASPTS